jgi:hypothetical protein
MSFRVVTPLVSNNSTLKMGMFFLRKVVNGKSNAWCRNPHATAKFLTHENLKFYNFYLPQL